MKEAHAPTTMQTSNERSPLYSPSRKDLEGENSRLSRSPGAEKEVSKDTEMNANFSSPSKEKTPPNNPLRRSLVLQLDQERRVRGETLESDVCRSENVTEDACLMPRDSELALIEALDLDSSHHRRPKLRLRPVNSFDMDEYCRTCGGSTAPFRTPRERRSIIPPRSNHGGDMNQTNAATTPYCQCHVTSYTSTTSQTVDGPLGPRLSFIHMTSPTRNQQLLVGGGSNGEINESLQLWLDDDDEDSVGVDNTGITHRNGRSAFRRRVILQPKATCIQRCHSDPAYNIPHLHLSSDQHEAPTSSQSAPDHHGPPGLLNSSSESSTATSPDEQVHSILSRSMTTSHAADTTTHPKNGGTNNTIVPQAATTLSSQQEQQHPADSTAGNIAQGSRTHQDNSNDGHVVEMPLLPTMATPESIRPLFRGHISLAPNRKSAEDVSSMQDLPNPPALE